MLCLIFRNSQIDKGAGQATQRASHYQPGKTLHDRAGGYQRADSWNGQRAEAKQQTHSPAHNAASRNPGRCHFRDLGFSLAGKVLPSSLVGHQDGDVTTGKSGSGETVDRCFHGARRYEDTEDCGAFSCHVVLFRLAIKFPEDRGPEYAFIDAK